MGSLTSKASSSVLLATALHEKMRVEGPASEAHLKYSRQTNLQAGRSCATEPLLV